MEQGQGLAARKRQATSPDPAVRRRPFAHACWPVGL